MITIGRFVLTPVVIYALLTGQYGLAFSAFVIAGLSDGVDGFIARHFNQRSELGAWLDPIADKLLLVSVFVVLGYLGKLPAWLVLAAVARDVLIIAGVGLAAALGRSLEIRPLLVSKINTAAQILLAATVLGALAFDLSLGLPLTMLIYASLLLTIASAAAYLVAWLRHMNGNGKIETP